MSRKELLSEPFYFINQILSLRIKKLSFFALRANRSIDRDQRKDESRPLWLIKAERSEVVHQRARSDLSFHWLGGGARGKVFAKVADRSWRARWTRRRRNERRPCNCDSIPHVCAIEPRIVAVATPIYRGNKQRRFLSTNDSRDDRLWLRSPLTLLPSLLPHHVLPHIFYDSARKGFGARTANRKLARRSVRSADN